MDFFKRIRFSFMVLCIINMLLLVGFVDNAKKINISIKNNIYRKNNYKKHNSPIMFFNANKNCNNRNYNNIRKFSYIKTFYKVKHRDTLFYIAWITGSDYKKLAQINNISKPYKLYTGQILKINRNKMLNFSNYSFKKKIITVFPNQDNSKHKENINSSKIKKISKLKKQSSNYNLIKQKNKIINLKKKLSYLLKLKSLTTPRILM